MTDFVPHSDRAGAREPGKTWDVYLMDVDALLQAMPERERKLAGLLWSIERYGDLNHTDDPAPIHMDLAERLFSTPGALQAVMKILSE